jgi:hypothetical protein
MTIAIALATLALFDALLAGVRAAAGRDGRIDKRSYFWRSMATAARDAVGVIAVNALVVGVLVATTPDPAASWAAFERAGSTCVWVFGAFAAATMAAIAFWFSPVPEYRTLATVIVLGPLTLVRPLVIVGGLAVAAAGSDEPRVWIVAIVAGASMLAFERFVGRTLARRRGTPHR